MIKKDEEVSLVLPSEKVSRIKWQYSESSQLQALATSHEELRYLLREAMKRADFYQAEDEIRLKCLEAIG